MTALFALLLVLMVFILPFTRPTPELIVGGAIAIALIVLFALFRQPTIKYLLCGAIAIVLVVELGIAQNKIQTNQIASSTSMDSTTNQLLDFVSQQPGRTIAITKDALGDFPYLIQSLRPNTHTLHQIRSIDGYDGGPWIQWRWINSLKALTANEFDTYLTLRSQISYPLNAETSARFAISWAVVDSTIAKGEVLLSGWEGPVMTSGDLELWSNPKAFMEARLYFGSKLVDITSKDWRSLLSQQDALVESISQELTCHEKVCHPQSIDYLTDNGDHMSLRVDTDRQAILVTSQSWHPDWKVYVDGKLVPTFPVDGYLLGILVKPGLSLIVMQFRPTWYEPLLVLSLSSIIIAAFLALRDRYRLGQSNVA
jgi:hypothetical protein